MALITCGNCSSVISSMAKSCPKCGNIRVESQLPSFNCDECGKAIAFEHEGPCPECGSPEPVTEVILRDPSTQPRKRSTVATEKTHGVQVAAGLSQPETPKLEVATPSQLQQEVIKKEEEELRKAIVRNGFEVRRRSRRCPSCNNAGEVGSKRTLFGKVSNLLENLNMVAWLAFAVSLAGCFFADRNGGAFGYLVLAAAVTLLLALSASMADDLVNFITPTEKYFCPKCGHQGFRFKEDL